MKHRFRRVRIVAQLTDLKMPGALEALDQILAGVDGGGFIAGEAIERLPAAQVAAAESGRKIYFGTLTELIYSLEEDKVAGRLERRLKTLIHPALLVADEIGYLPVSQSGAILFFQLINRR